MLERERDRECVLCGYMYVDAIIMEAPGVQLHSSEKGNNILCP